MLPEIKNKSDKLHPDASRCNSICAREVLVTYPTAMLDTMKLWELWELTAKHHFTQMILFCGSLRLPIVRLAEAQKMLQGFGYFHNFKTLDLARIRKIFMIYSSLC